MDTFLKLYFVGYLTNSRYSEGKNGRAPTCYYTITFMGGSFEFGVQNGDTSVEQFVNSGRLVQVLVPAVTRPSVRTYDGQSFADTKIVPCAGGVEVKALD